MKKRVGIIITAVIIIAIALLAIYSMPYNAEHEFTCRQYLRDESLTENSTESKEYTYEKDITVKISGKITRKFFARPEFKGDITVDGFLLEKEEVELGDMTEMPSPLIYYNGSRIVVFGYMYGLSPKLDKAIIVIDRDGELHRAVLVNLTEDEARTIADAAFDRMIMIGF